MTNIVWAQETDARQIDLVGGKGANLGEMLRMGLPVPPAFVVTARAYHSFLREADIETKITRLLERLDVDSNKALNEASRSVQEIVLKAPMPKGLEQAVRDAYRQLGDAELVRVAVRSSATAEDLPEASFAGQQDTYLHVVGPDDTVEHVRKCWASLFTPRAIYYRTKNHFPHEKVHMAVVVQRMVESDASGVMFTRHPTTGERGIIVEAAWGLGEAVVSGKVTPDNYVLERDGRLREETIATKKLMIVPVDGGRGTRETEVPRERRDRRVLSDEHLARLVRLADTLEKHYGKAQDVEWAFEGDELFVLQTRPITTITSGETDMKARTTDGETKEADVLLKGLGASPGTAGGAVVQVHSIEELDKCREGNVLVTTMTTPDMVPAMRRAAAIVTDEGGMTCHAAIVGRELGIPCVVGTKRATKLLTDGTGVTIHGDRGLVTKGITVRAKRADEGQTQAQGQGPAPARIITGTDVKVNISMPEATERAVATGADGVGLLRIEHIILGLGEHPLRLIDGGREEEYVSYLVKNIGRVAHAFYPRPVWVRTLDAPTDEFRALPGGENEPKESNPMLGWRGIRRGLEQTQLLAAEFKAIQRLRDQGATNVGVMLPLVQHPTEIRRAKEIAKAVGLDPGSKTFPFGIMVEIPAAALIIDDLLDEGLDFVSFGTNDLTQYTLAVDRNNEHVAPLFNEFHPAIAVLIKNVITACNKRGVETSICGQAGSNPKFVEKLVEWGITSVSANIDAVERVRETVARAERRLLLKKVRDAS